MPHVALPFPESDWSALTHSEAGCGVCASLPEPLSELARELPHLRRYLHHLPTEEHGVPTYAEEVKRSMSAIEQPNIIYPVGRATFAHICPDPRDARNFYIPIEPTILSDYESLMEIVEGLLVEAVH